METKELEKDFLTMVEAQKRTIYKVCYIYANDQDDLNDLYQETVLNLWKSFPRYRGDSKLTTWVYRIAMNTCITFLRRTNARPHRTYDGQCGKHCRRGGQDRTTQRTLLSHQPVGQIGPRADSPLVGRTEL